MLWSALRQDQVSHLSYLTQQVSVGRSVTLRCSQVRGSPGESGLVNVCVCGPVVGVSRTCISMQPSLVPEASCFEGHMFQHELLSVTRKKVC